MFLAEEGEQGRVGAPVGLGRSAETPLTASRVRLPPRLPSSPRMRCWVLLGEPPHAPAQTAIGGRDTGVFDGYLQDTVGPGV